MADADRAGQGASEFRAFLRGLPSDIALATERNPGNPIVYRPERAPDGHTLRLMATLGVPVEVLPVVAAAAVNKDVKVREGTDGGIVVVSAWCSRCRDAVMPTPAGLCSWCQSVIVDEDTLSSKTMRGQLNDARPALAAVPAPDPVEGRKPGPKPTWTQERIIQAVKAHADEHGGPPTSTEWRYADPAGRRPTADLVVRVFRKWSAAIAVAGFDAPRRGRKPALSRREPQGPETAIHPLSPAADGLTANQPAAVAGSPEPSGNELGSRLENADELAVLGEPGARDGAIQRAADVRSPHPTPGSPSARRKALAELLRTVADTVEHTWFSDEGLALIFDGCALEARKGLDA